MHAVRGGRIVRGNSRPGNHKGDSTVETPSAATAPRVTATATGSTPSAHLHQSWMPAASFAGYCPQAPWRVRARRVLCLFVCLASVCWCFKTTVARNRDWKSELSLFEAAYTVEPDSVKVLNNLAMHLMNQDGKARERAAKMLQRSLELLPRYASGHFNLGLVYMLQNHRTRAIRHLRASIAVENDGSSGKVYGYLGRELVQEYNAVRDTAGDASADTAGKTCEAFSTTGTKVMLYEAIDHLHASGQRGCTLPMVTFELGCAYSAAMQYNWAIELYEDALVRNAVAGMAPGERIQQESLLNMYALTLKDVGRLPEASMRYEDALATAPTMFELLANAAATYGEIASSPAHRVYPIVSSRVSDIFPGPRVDAAARRRAELRTLNLYQIAAFHSPSSPALENNLGYFQERMGNLEDALSSYKRALALLPGHSQIIVNVRNVERQVGDKKEEVTSDAGAW